MKHAVGFAVQGIKDAHTHSVVSLSPVIPWLVGIRRGYCGNGTECDSEARWSHRPSDVVQMVQCEARQRESGEEHLPTFPSSDHHIGDTNDVR